MNNYYRNLIADEFRNCVNDTIERVMGTEQTYRPFHMALLSEDVVFWSAFERSFSTSFGQRVIEEIVCLNVHGIPLCSEFYKLIHPVEMLISELYLICGGTKMVLITTSA